MRQSEPQSKYKAYLTAWDEACQKQLFKEMSCKLLLRHVQSKNIEILEVERSWVSSAEKLSSAAFAELLKCVSWACWVICWRCWSMGAEPAEWFAEGAEAWMLSLLSDLLKFSSAMVQHQHQILQHSALSWAEVQHFSTFFWRTP